MWRRHRPRPSSDGDRRSARPMRRCRALPRTSRQPLETHAGWPGSRPAASCRSRPRRAPPRRRHRRSARAGGRRGRRSRRARRIRADEPRHCAVEQRDAGGSVRPCAAAELVDLVARLAAEQARSDPCGRARTRARRGASPSGRRRHVRLATDRPARNRGGSMLTWLAKPTRQPARSPPAAVVTMYSGGSAWLTNSATGSLLTVPRCVRG